MAVVSFCQGGYEVTIQIVHTLVILLRRVRKIAKKVY